MPSSIPSDHLAHRRRAWRCGRAAVLALCTALSGLTQAADTPGPHLNWQAVTLPPGCSSVDANVLRLAAWQFSRWDCRDGHWLVLQQVIRYEGPRPVARVVSEVALPGRPDEAFLSCTQAGTPVLGYTRDTEALNAGRAPRWLQVWGFDLDRGRITAAPLHHLECEFDAEAD
ncbi:hypothetical protein AACH06_25345 [Ideonella sp. DXS29W]|uniref:Uncharacterized protein n=1 Tax=Ideonella lacteola TaxID=2984193 RepID=A0ABU9BW16_9BURK